MQLLILALAVCVCATSAHLLDPKKPWHPPPATHAHHNMGPRVSERAFDLTWELWEHKKRNLNVTSRWQMPVKDGECPTLSQCDQPAVRNQYANAGEKIIRVRTVVVLDNGNWPDGLTESILQEQQSSMDSDYAQQNIKFVWEETQVVTSTVISGCIPAYSASSDWLEKIDLVKKEFFTDPMSAINVLITCQTPGNEGTLLGMGTFPWDPAVLTLTGGLWNNARAISGSAKTLNHEFGHNLGLWHTFHGISELDGCSTQCNVFERCTWACACADPCVEVPHDTDLGNDNHYDTVGDFCSDTASTPRHWECRDPGDEVCDINGNDWASHVGKSGYDNIMGYSGDECIDKLTPQQAMRVHCYLDVGLSHVLVSKEEYEAYKRKRAAGLRGN